MSIFCMLLIHFTITAIFKFLFYLSHSWLTFCAPLLDAILPTELLILYFQSISDIYQTIVGNGKYKTYKKIQKKQRCMPSLADSFNLWRKKTVPQKASNVDMYVQVSGVSLAAVNIRKLVELLWNFIYTCEGDVEWTVTWEVCFPSCEECYLSPLFNDILFIFCFTECSLQMIVLSPKSQITAVWPLCIKAPYF